MAINFNQAEFVLSAVKPATFIRDGRPQVTFAGRSNVGKSSVINRLLNRKNFARVGAAPGKTTQINYFLIDKSLYLIAQINRIYSGMIALYDSLALQSLYSGCYSR